MLEIEKSENFNIKYSSLGETGQKHFLLRFNATWKMLTDAHLTNEENHIKRECTILGTDKKFIAEYSRNEATILLDIMKA